MEEDEAKSMSTAAIEWEKQAGFLASVRVLEDNKLLVVVVVIDNFFY